MRSLEEIVKSNRAAAKQGVKQPGGAVGVQHPHILKENLKRLIALGPQKPKE